MPVSLVANHEMRQGFTNRNYESAYITVYYMFSSSPVWRLSCFVPTTFPRYFLWAQGGSWSAVGTLPWKQAGWKTLGWLTLFNRVYEKSWLVEAVSHWLILAIVTAHELGIGAPTEFMIMLIIFVFSILFCHGVRDLSGKLVAGPCLPWGSRLPQELEFLHGSVLVGCWV